MQVPAEGGMPRSRTGEGLDDDPEPAAAGRHPAAGLGNAGATIGVVGGEAPSSTPPCGPTRGAPACPPAHPELRPEVVLLGVVDLKDIVGARSIARSGGAGSLRSRKSPNRRRAADRERSPQTRAGRSARGRKLVRSDRSAGVEQQERRVIAERPAVIGFIAVLPPDDSRSGGGGGGGGSRSAAPPVRAASIRTTGSGGLVEDGVPQQGDLSRPDAGSFRNSSSLLPHCGGALRRCAAKRRGRISQGVMKIEDCFEHLGRDRLRGAVRSRSPDGFNSCSRSCPGRCAARARRSALGDDRFGHRRGTRGRSQGDAGVHEEIGFPAVPIQDCCEGTPPAGSEALLSAPWRTVAFGCISRAARPGSDHDDPPRNARTRCARVAPRRPAVDGFPNRSIPRIQTRSAARRRRGHHLLRESGEQFITEAGV